MKLMTIGRIVMKPCGVVFCFAILTMPSALLAANGRRPNIVFVFGDDFGRHTSAYAKIDGPGTMNDVVQTPNFDRIAREGVLFRRAFVSAPSCTPCRSAVISGQHFWRTGNGAILSGAVWDGTMPSFPLMLRDSGYHIGKSYKVWSPGTPVDEPFGGQKYAYEKAGDSFRHFSTSVAKLMDAGHSVDAAKQVLYDEVSNNFGDFLTARRPDQPFCYWFGPTNTHRKWMPGSGRTLWELNPDALQGKLPGFIPDVPEVRDDLADYFGEVQALDAAIGILIKKLEEIGELDQTLVVISGDHGAPGFPHGKCNLYDFGSSVSLAIRGAGTIGGRVVDDFVSLTDLAPTFLELAGVQVPQSMTGRSLVDVLTSNQSGQVDPRRSEVFIGRERHTDSARPDGAPYPQRAIRTDEFLYIINFRPDRWPLGDPFRLDGDNPPSDKELSEVTRTTFHDVDAGPTKTWMIGKRNDPNWKTYFDLFFGKRPREELYDLKMDPQQLKNVANDPVYSEARRTMERRLIEELTRTGDPRLVDDGRFFETPPMSGPISR